MVRLAIRWVAVMAEAQAAQPVWLRLSFEDRVRVLSALAMLLLLGFAFAMFVWCAGRWTRRYMNRAPRTPAAGDPHADDWTRKPLVADEEPPLEPRD
jgi:hypothetical protein